MRVPYGEGVAIHIGPEPCADACKGVGEASAGECAGQPLSRERPVILGADTVPNVEGHTHGRAISERLDDPAWSQTVAWGSDPLWLCWRGKPSSRSVDNATPRAGGVNWRRQLILGQ